MDTLTYDKYKQMCGRAGRTGKTKSGEVIIVCNEMDKPKIKNVITPEQVESIHSAFSYKTLEKSILEAISSTLCSSHEQVVEFIHSCFLYFNACQSKDCVICKKIIESKNDKEELSKVYDFHKYDENDAKVSMCRECIDKTLPSVIENLKNKKFLKEGTKYDSTELGKASFASSLMPLLSSKVYDEIVIMRQHLVISTDLHLLFLSISVDNTITPTWDIMYKKLSNLTTQQKTIAQLCNVNIDDTYLLQITNLHSGSDRPSMYPLHMRFITALMLLDMLNDLTIGI